MPANRGVSCAKTTAKKMFNEDALAAKKHLHFFGLQFDEVDKLFALFAHAVPAIKFKRGSVNATASKGTRTCSARRP